MRTMMMVATEQASKRPKPTERFYRILIDQIESGPYAQMAEVELLDANNVDLLDPETTIATASSNYSAWSYGPEKLMDNQGGNSKWTSEINQHIGSWVQFELIEAARVVALTIQNHGSEHFRQPRAFRFQSSVDGVEWVTVKAFTGVNNWLPNEVRRFDLAT